MTGEDRGALQARGADHVGEPHAGPFRAAGAAIGPLVAARLRREERAAVAAAFEHQAPRHRPEPLLEFAERELELLVDLAVDGDLPAVGVALRLRNGAVVADEELVGRRGVVVEQASGVSATSGRSPSTTSPSFLPGNFRYCGPLAWRRLLLLRERRRDQPARHVGRKRDGAADRGAHGRKPAAAEKAAPVDVGPAPEHGRVGPLRIVPIKLVDGPFDFVRHGVSPWCEFSIGSRF